MTETDTSRSQLGDPPTDRGPILGIPKDDYDALLARAERAEAERDAALAEIERLRLLARRAFLEGHGYARIELGEGTDMDANYRAALLSFASSKTSKAIKGDDQ